MSAARQTATRQVKHASFTIERRYDAAPERVFKSFSDLEAKKRWFGCSDEWTVEKSSLDFREGGTEVWRVGPPGGPLHINNTLYFDIVPNERFVSAYEMYLGASRISVSLLTVEFRPDGTGTKLILTEHDAFLDDYEDGGSRAHGTGIGLDVLARELAD